LQTERLEASRASLRQDAANNESLQAYALRAPIDGTVSALVARRGEVVTAQSTLMTIVPSGAEFQVELSIPGSAIGFIATGQNVRVAVDAFPYQRFGTVEGTIVSVSTSPIPEQRSDGTTVPVYRAIVNLKDSKIFAFGQQQPLVSGMEVSARIVTEKSSLIEWLFEPLFAVSRR
jgi:membrane fusion protein